MVREGPWVPAHISPQLQSGTWSAYPGAEEPGPLLSLASRELLCNMSSHFLCARVALQVGGAWAPVCPAQPGPGSAQVSGPWQGCFLGLQICGRDCLLCLVFLKKKTKTKYHLTCFSVLEEYLNVEGPYGRGLRHCPAASAFP